MVRLWTRIIAMPDSRIPKIVFLWEKQQGKRNCWSAEVKSILEKCDLATCFRENSLYGMSSKMFLESVKQKLTYICAENWKKEVNGMPKLRTYAKIKTEYGQDQILCKTITPKHRSVISKIRSGTFPIEIETGRYRQIALQDRLCKSCRDQAIEDEMHFVIKCCAYDNERQLMINSVELKLNILSSELPDEELFKVLLCTPDILSDVAKFLMAAYDQRSSFH